MKLRKIDVIKQLFTINEYYDRNRTEYYKTIQSVRESSMDMTKWPEYFTFALAEQMHEIRTKGEFVIRANVIEKRHNLSERQTQAIKYILQHGELATKDFETIYTDVPRRSLQRNLKNLVNKKLLFTEGATNQLIYKLAP